MKRFKIIDFWVSTTLIIGFVLYALIRQDDNFFIGYFVVGGWQIISMLVHFINQWFCKHGSARYSYHWAVVIIILCTALGFAVYAIMYLVLFMLLIAAPVMAIFYAWLCYKETYIKMKRPLSILK